MLVCLTFLRSAAYHGCLKEDSKFLKMLKVSALEFTAAANKQSY